MQKKYFMITFICIGILFQSFSSPLASPDQGLNLSLIEAVRDGDLTEVIRLLDAGADVNTRGHILPEDAYTSQTALMVAAYLGARNNNSSSAYPEIVRTLIERGADVNAIDHLGRTALAWIILPIHPYRNGSVIFEILIEGGADVNLRQPGHSTLLMKAADWNNTDIMRLLVESVESGAERRRFVNERIENGGTALMVAASVGGFPETVGFLIENGADVSAAMNSDAENYAGYTALIFAAKWGHHDIVRMLIEHGADVNARATDGETALMSTLAFRIVGISGPPYSAIIRTLISAGADVNARNNNGETALILAEACGDDEIAQILRDAGARK